MRRRESVSDVQVDKCSQLACQHLVDDFGRCRNEKIKCLKVISREKGGFEMQR